MNVQKKDTEKDLKINKLMVSMEDREGKNYTNLSLKYFTCFKDFYIL